MTKIGNLVVKILFLNLSAVLLFSIGVNAETQTQTQVEAVLDRDQMGLGDAFTLSVTVSSNEDFEAAPKLPQLNGIEVINTWADGKSSSTRMGFINGKSEFSKKVQQTFHFMLSPNKEGKLVIPVMDIAINDKTYKTQPLTIDVSEAHRGAVSKRQQKTGRGQLLPGLNDEDPFLPGGPGGQGDDDIFSQILREREKILGQLQRGGTLGGNPFGAQENIPEKKLNINTNEAFFVLLEADRSEAFEGQQVTANWYIYVRGQIESLDRTKFPDLKGFWKEIIEEVPSLQFTPEIVNGVPYQKALLASHALFPIKPGIAVIDEFKIKARTRMPTQFGMGKAHEFTKVSKRHPIKVLPLPIADKPKNFSGAVGSFQVSMRTEGNSFQAHQPFSVKIRFEGSGNAKLIDMPTIAWPEGLEVYDTKSESKFFKNAQSYKEFEVLLIPRKSGEVVIPAFEFSHFNPELKKYITTVTEPLLLTITPGQPGAINSANAPSVGAVAEDGQTTHLNIQPIVEMPEAQLITKKMRWSFYTTVFILTVLAMGTSFFKKFKNLLNEPSLELIITKKLKQLDQFITNKDFRHVGTEGVNLTYALAAYLSGQKAANLEWSKLIEIMPINLKERFIAPLSSSFEYFQLLGFSPEAVHKSIVSANQTETEIKKLKKTADEISKELRKNESE